MPKITLPSGGAALLTPNAIPSDIGLKAWIADQSGIAAAISVTAATQYLVRLPVRETLTFSLASMHIAVIGSGATPLLNCFLGLYDKAGTLRGKTADQAAAWSAGAQVPKEATLTAEGGQNLTISAADGYCWWSLLVGQQATTPMTMYRITSSASGLLDQNSTPPARFLSKAAVGSALPASITVSTFATTASAYWAGLG